MTESLLSVIICIYNIQDYLEECLQSVISQKYKNIEILLIDDGSTDNSLQICKEFAVKDSRIKIISQENKGLAESRNVGLKAASGDFISFVDGDDVVSSIMFDSLVNNLNSTGADIAVCSFTRDKTKLQTDVTNSNNQTFDGKLAVKFLFGETIYGNYVWNKIYKKELFDTISFFPGKTHEDIYVMPKLFLNANKVVFCEDELYFYRKRPNQITDYENPDIQLVKSVISAKEYLLKDESLKEHHLDIVAEIINIIDLIYFTVNDTKYQNDKQRKQINNYLKPKIRLYFKPKYLGLEKFVKYQFMFKFYNTKVFDKYLEFKRKK